MVQAKLEGFVAPETYREQLAAQERGQRLSQVQRAMRCLRMRREREHEILKLLRGRMFLKDLYGQFVERSAVLGWPIIGAAMFAKIVKDLEAQGRVRREIRSFGRYGKATIVQIRTSTDRRHEEPGTSERTVIASTDS